MKSLLPVNFHDCQAWMQTFCVVAVYHAIIKYRYSLYNNFVRHPIRAVLHLSSPTMIIGWLGLKAMWVSFVFFFCVTSCSQSGSYLLMLRSNTWTWTNKWTFLILRIILLISISISIVMRQVWWGNISLICTKPIRNFYQRKGRVLTVVM